MKHPAALKDAVLGVDLDDIAIGSQPIAVRLQFDGGVNPPKARLHTVARELPLAPMLIGTMP